MSNSETESVPNFLYSEGPFWSLTNYNDNLLVVFFTVMILQRLRQKIQFVVFEETCKDEQFAHVTNFKKLTKRNNFKKQFKLFFPKFAEATSSTIEDFEKN